MLKARASTSGLRQDSDGAFSVPGDTVWNIPLIENLGMPAGQALVGDFFLGCSLFMREGVHVLTSDADQDDFLRSRVTMLGICRAGFAVWQPKCFASVALSFPN
jgi:HK97 family phage major capsid protein